jgi:formylglycine-generating enzyme required for sulfatase activity
VIRGGSFYNYGDYLQVGYRYDYYASGAYNDIGFRFARTN